MQTHLATTHKAKIIAIHHDVDIMGELKAVIAATNALSKACQTQLNLTFDLDKTKLLFPNHKNQITSEQQSIADTHKFQIAHGFVPTLGTIRLDYHKRKAYHTDQTKRTSQNSKTSPTLPFTQTST